MSVATEPEPLWPSTNFRVSIGGVDLGCRSVRGLGSASAWAPAPARQTVTPAPGTAGSGPPEGSNDGPTLVTGAATLALPGMGERPLAAAGEAARLAWTLTPIVLTRAVDGNRSLFDWRANVVSGMLDLREVLIELLGGAGGEPVQVWRVKSAWPLSWSAPDFDALTNGIACERAELAYASVQWLDNTSTGGV